MTSRQTAYNPLDIAAVTAICFGWFIFISIESVAAGFPDAYSTITDGDLIALVEFELIVTAAALLYLRLRGHDLKLLLPKPTLKGSLMGFGLYIVTLFASITLVTLAAGVYTPTSAPTVEAVFGDAVVTLYPVLVLSIVNGLFEEVFLLGYLQNAFDRSGTAFAIGVVVLVRLLYHLYQGPYGAVSVLGFGIVLGIYYAYTKRLWPAVFAHVIADILGLLNV